MRIVAGRHRGRRLVAPEGVDVRPTSDRVREALFNILLHAPFAGGGDWTLADVRVLDAFAGSGALGLEALSRGAGQVTFMDMDTAALAAIRRNAAALGETGNAHILRADPTQPPPADAACRLVLMDPPYGSGLAAAALVSLAEQGWIGPGAVCAIELGREEAFDPPTGFMERDARSYGAARLVFLTRS